MESQLDSTTGRMSDQPAALASPQTALAVDDRVTEIATLLKSLNEAAAVSGRSAKSACSARENELVQVRLGIATSLFTALRSKHAPTAAHSLRVALGCSAWAIEMELPQDQRDAIEVASLLHDVGKIGVPDRVLSKPGKLGTNEAEVMVRHVQMGLEILESCSASADILEMVRCASGWYDGSRGGLERKGKSIPLGARMLAIMDAFDAMTTDQVYRPAWSRERALAELFQFAGTQFDPDLVKQFSELHAGDPNQLQAKGAQRWLESLAADASNAQWRLGGSERPRGEPLTPDALFEQKLLNNMRDGVVFVDSQLQVFLWNRGAERLTGIPGSAVYLRHWAPSLLTLRDQDRRLLHDEECSVAHTVQTGVQSYRRVIMPARNGNDVPVDLHAMAVIGKDGTTYGATVVLHDVSPETSLEERCQSLHDQATKDPMTGVANRAEFDRMHERFIQAHMETRLSCSLIVCDIDYFKRVNDQYGHQAGDEAIKSLATLLKSKCQPGDLVARYGGEEFVVLCADCNNAAVAQRAEQIRRELADMSLPILGNGHITASFGVTELQPGDTPDTMFRRADRALLQAKDMGRNLVVQLGTGMSSEEPKRRWWSFQRSTPELLVETQLFTSVPIGIAVEKLRGFMADHDATINSVTADQLQLTIAGTTPPWQSGDGERFVPLVLDMQFSERYLEQPAAPGSVRSATSQTNVHVSIRPRRSRDGRREDTADRARQVLASLKSYLIATEKPFSRDKKFAKAPKRPLFSWGSNRNH